MSRLRPILTESLSEFQSEVERTINKFIVTTSVPATADMDVGTIVFGDGSEDNEDALYFKPDADKIVVLPSKFVHAEMSITASSETTINTVNVWEAAAGTWALTSSPAAHAMAMSTNGQLKYTGTRTRDFHIAASFSITSAGNNKIYEVGIAVDGTVSTPSIVRRKITTGTDVGTGALHGFLQLATNSYVTLVIRNITDATNATLDLANVFAMGMFV